MSGRRVQAGANTKIEKCPNCKRWTLMVELGKKHCRECDYRE